MDSRCEDSRFSVFVSRVTISPRETEVNPGVSKEPEKVLV